MTWKSTPNQEVADLLTHIGNLATGIDCIEGTCDRVVECKNMGSVCIKAYNLIVAFANKRANMAKTLNDI